MRKLVRLAGANGGPEEDWAARSGDGASSTATGAALSTTRTSHLTSIPAPGPNRTVRRPGQVLAAALLCWFASATASALVITEIQYHSDQQNPDGTEDKRFEFIEIFNENRDPVDLSGYVISDGVDYVFPPGTFLDGYRYLVICADPSTVQSTYGINNVVGPWSEFTALSNSGERIRIVNPGGADVVRVTYNDRGKWPSGADGSGHSLVIRDPYIEVDDPDHWRLSRDVGGSPGRADPEPAEFTVRINEGFLATNEGRFVELYNTGDSEVDLSGHHLTTDRLDFAQATIPAGTTIAPRSWVAFTEADLGLGLSIPVDDDRLYVALTDAAAERVLDAYIFRPQVAGASEARFPDGDEDVEDAATPTPGAANLIPVTRDVVINEIMYHPTSENLDDEFVELYNRGSQSVDLSGWEFNKGINYVFAPGTSIPAGGYLVVARNPAHIQQVYGLAASEVVGPRTPEALDDFGRLADAGERITLKDAIGNTADTVRYRDGGEWPHWADGRGSSLELIDPFQDNNTAQAWDASDDSHKSQVETFVYTGRYEGGEPEFQFFLKGRGVAIVDDVAISPDGGGLVEETVFIERGDTWRFFRGTQEPSNPTSAWRQAGFDDTSWESGPTGIGYGDGDDATEIPEMEDSFRTIFCRREFSVADRDAIERLVLAVIVDDGFYAYLNGVQVASHNVNSPAFDADAAQAGEPQDIIVDITDHLDALVEGDNVLAIQVHNGGISSSDLSFNPRLYSARFDAGGGINLLTNGDFETSDAGWKLEGNHVRSGHTSAEAISGSGSLKIVSTGRGDYKVNRIETPDGNVGLQSLQTGVLYTIRFKAKWVVGSRSIQTRGYNNAFPRNHQFDIPADLGTPGERNSATSRRIAQTGSSNMGPVMRNLEQTPAQPGSNQPVQVAVRVADSDDVASVKLLYATGNPPGFQPGGSGDPEPVGIFDDHRDVGNPCGQGDTTLAGSTYTVTGGGEDIWTGGDQFQYTYKVVTGDFSMRARIVDRQWGPSRWGKSGIMARQTLDTTSRYAFLHDNPPEDAARFAQRPTHQGSDNFETVVSAGDPNPDWLRLDRVGNSFRAYFSSDGSSWGAPLEVMDWGTNAPRTIYLGLALTSHAGCDTATITFDNVVITGGDDPPDPIGGVGDEGVVNLSDADGDRIYTGSIPGFASPTKVVYLIEATDSLGNVGRFPVDELGRANPMVLDPAEASVLDEKFLVYGHGSAPSNPRSYHTYQFWMHDTAEAYLGSRLLQSNDVVEGSFVFRDDRIFHGSGIRFSGSPWARQGWGGSFRVKFPRDEPLYEKIRKFNVEDHQGSGGLDARERTSHYLIRYNQGMISVPYSEQWFVRWRVNTRTTEDREHVAPPNKQFLEAWFRDADEGDFFEMDDRFEFNDSGGRVSNRDASLTYPPHSSGSGADKENYRFYLGLRQHEDEDDYDRLIELCRLMDPSQTSNAAFDAQIFDTVDVEQFLRVLMVRTNTDDWDTWGTRRGKNAYVYFEPVEERWKLFAWDLELTYGDVNTFLIPSSPSQFWDINNLFPEVERWLNRPAVRRIAYGVMKEMVDHHFHSSHLTPYMSRVASIGGQRTEIGRSGGFVDQRRSRLLPRLSAVTYPTRQLTISGADPREVDAPFITLSGNAPVEASFLQVVVNGVVAPDVRMELSNSSLTAWTLRDVPLEPGANVVEVLGFDGTGELVDSDSVRITSSFDRDPPVIDALDPAAAEPGSVLVIHGQNFFSGLDVAFGSTTLDDDDVTFEPSVPGEIEVVVPADIGLGSFAVQVINRPDNKVSNTMDFEVLAPEPRFIRGDANLDGRVEIGDAVHVLVHAFVRPVALCEEALDVDDDEAIDQSDAVRILAYLFLSDAPPAAPFPVCARDTDGDAIGCAEGAVSCF